MSETPASILLIDDHPLLRQGIKQLIGMEDDMEVIGEAAMPPMASAWPPSWSRT